MALLTGLCVLSTVGLQGCKDDPAPVRVAPPAPVASAPASAQSVRLGIAEKGLARFLIDAPLEKIKGHSDKVRGEITVDPSNLTATRGEVDVDLDALVTETFDDTAKNTAQTGHAHNWLEIGTDVEAKRREENRYARFAIQAVDDVVPSGAPGGDGPRTFVLSARGNLWVHGVGVPKTLKLTTSFEGPVQAPTAVHVTTVSPLTISLHEHDIKPRDVAGKFLQGALEQVGKKIDDNVQVSLDIMARSGKI